MGKRTVNIERETIECEDRCAEANGILRRARVSWSTDMGRASAKQHEIDAVRAARAQRSSALLRLRRLRQLTDKRARTDARRAAKAETAA